MRYLCSYNQTLWLFLRTNSDFRLYEYRDARLWSCAALLSRPFKNVYYLFVSCSNILASIDWVMFIMYHVWRFVKKKVEKSCYPTIPTAQWPQHLCSPSRSTGFSPWLMKCSRNAVNPQTTWFLGHLAHPEDWDFYCCPHIGRSNTLMEPSSVLLVTTKRLNWIVCRFIRLIW